jgi:hypothetical protein
MIISFYFGKSAEMTGYPIGIKVRHEMKTNSVAAKQLNVRIINKFFDYSPK